MRHLMSLLKNPQRRKICSVIFTDIPILPDPIDAGMRMRNACQVLGLVTFGETPVVFGYRFDDLQGAPNKVGELIEIERASVGAVSIRSAVMSPRERMDGVELIEKRAGRMLRTGGADFLDDARERVIGIEERWIGIGAVSLDDESHLGNNVLRRSLSGFVKAQKIDDRGRDTRFARIFKLDMFGL
jgi:hypothetical protein